MEAHEIITIGKQAITTAFMIGAPILLTSLIVGVMISIFQAATSISDATLNFAPKVVVAGLVLMLMMPWIIRKIVGLMVQLITQIPDLIR